MATFKTVAELLESPERWCKGLLKSPTGPFPGVAWCIEGACMEVYAGGVGNCNDAYYAALEKIRNVVGDVVHEWQDDPDRTHAEVIAAVRAAGI